MITVSAVSSASEASGYYSKDALGNEFNDKTQAGEYYTNDVDKNAAKWAGSLADDYKHLTFSRESLEQTLSGVMPDGKALPVGPSGTRSPGWDVTASAPKSVSVMALAAKDERVIRAHDKAVEATIKKMESIVTARIKSQGNVERERGVSLLAATVRHDTNREQEPQLHTHIVVANVAKTSDGNLRAIESIELYKAQKELDQVYKRELAFELEKAGYQLEKRIDSGSFEFEIKGVSERTIFEFSTRSNQVEAALKAMGKDRQTATAEERQIAALDTRTAKVPVKDREVLEKKWQVTALSTGTDYEAILANTYEKSESDVYKDKLEKQREEKAFYEVMRTIQKLTTNEASVSIRSVRDDVRSRSDLTDKQIEEAIDALKQKKTIVERPVFDRKLQHETRGFSTLEQVKSERDLASLSLALAKSDKQLVSAKLADEAVKVAVRNSKDSGHSLTQEHQKAIKGLLSQKGQLKVLNGRAGTAKTSAVLKHTTEALKQQGYKVIALAPTVSATKNLQKEAGMTDSMTLQKFVSQQRVQALKGDSSDSLWQDIKSSHAAFKESSRVSREISAYKDAIKRLENMRKDTTVFGQNLMSTSGRQRLRDALRDPFEKKDTSLGAKIKRAWTAGQAFRAKDGSVLSHGFTGWSKLDPFHKAVAWARGKFGSEQKQIDAKVKEWKEKIEHLKEQKAEFQREGWGSSKAVYVVDEAGLADTKQLQQIMNYAAQTGANVILVGDEKQHGSVGAGNALHQVNQVLDNAGHETYELTTILRQSNEELRKAVEASIDGKISQAFDKLENGGGKVVEVKDAEERSKEIAKEFAKLSDQDREKTIIVDPNKKSGQALTENVRDALKAEKKLGEDYSFSVFEKKTIEQTERTKADRYEKGDVFRDVKTGDKLAQVLDVNKERNEITIRTEKGETKTFNASKIDDVLKKEGSGAGVEVGTYVEKKFAVGEKIRATSQNSDVEKGQSLSIKEIDSKKGFVVAEKQNGQRVSLSKKQMENMAHGYVWTSHSAQGQTFDKAMINMSSKAMNLSNQQTFYVAMSRAKKDVTIFTDDKAKLKETVQRNDGQNTTALTDKQLKESVFEGIKQSADKPVQEQQADKPVQEQQADKPVQEQQADKPVQDKPAQEQSADKPVQEQSADKPAQDKPAQEQTKDSVNVSTAEDVIERLRNQISSDYKRDEKDVSESREEATKQNEKKDPSKEEYKRDQSTTSKERTSQERTSQEKDKNKNEDKNEEQQHERSHSRGK